MYNVSVSKWDQQCQWLKSSGFRSSVESKKKYILSKHSKLLVWGRLDWKNKYGKTATLAPDTARIDLVRLGNWLSRAMNSHLHLHAFYSPENSRFEPHSHVHFILQANGHHQNLKGLIYEGWTMPKYVSEWVPDKTRVSMGGVNVSDYKIAEIDNNLRYCLGGHLDLELNSFCGVRGHKKRCAGR